MSSDLSARVILQEGMRFTATTGTGYRVALDSAETDGGTAVSPMELVLIGLAGCGAMDAVNILRKKHQLIDGLEVHAYGQQRDAHPTIFTEITLHYIVRGTDIDSKAVAQAIDLSSERYCPVWAMLAPQVAITTSFRILARREEFAIPVD